MHRKMLRTTLLGAGISVLTALLAFATASAQVKPGDVITPRMLPRSGASFRPASTTWSSMECR